MQPRESTRARSQEARRCLLALGAVAAAAAACAAEAPMVRPDEASAAQHRQEAARERTIADNLQAKVVPVAGLPNPYRDPITREPNPFYGPTIYDPTEGYLDAVNRHREHARQHLAAARELEAFEQSQCKDFPAAARAACPLLGPARSVQNLPTGVRITFAPAARIDAIVAHMQCHLAYARAAGYPQPSACPLYLRGVVIARVGSTPSVDITSTDPATAARIWKEAREEVVLDAATGAR
jgi:hypothetical protein